MIKLPKIILILFLIVNIIGCKSEQKARLDNREAKIFCESFIPLLDKYYEKNGDYPETIPDEWLAGKTVPSLIRADSFYLRYSNEGKNYYLLRFQDYSVAIFGDNVFGYHSGPPYNGKWLNYDGY